MCYWDCNMGGVPMVSIETEKKFPPLPKDGDDYEE